MVEYEFDEKNNEIRILLPTNLYPIQGIILASSKFTLDFWIYIDGDPAKEILVCIQPKNEKIETPEILFNEYMNHIIAGVKEVI